MGGFDSHILRSSHILPLLNTVWRVWSILLLRSDNCFFIASADFWSLKGKWKIKRRKICDDLKMCEPKPPIISHQCVVYKYKCDLCDAEYVGYTSRRTKERPRSGNHRRPSQELFRFKEVQRKTGLSDLWNVVIHKEEKAMLEHTIRLHTRKTIYNL